MTRLAEIFIIHIVLCLTAFCRADDTRVLKLLDQYNVVYDSPSANALDSMPLGNGDIGVNVWVEKTGDILLYIAKTDAWSEHSQLLKLGRIRLQITPRPLANASNFQQLLNLKDGEVFIRMGCDPNSISIRVWVDAHNPIVRIETQGSSVFRQRVSFETWRTSRRQLKDLELGTAIGVRGGPDPVYVEPDTIARSQNEIIWYHHNSYSIWKQNLSILGVGNMADDSLDPLLFRTFGGYITSPSLQKINDTTLESPSPIKSCLTSIYLNTGIHRDPADWVKNIKSFSAGLGANDIERMRTAHRQWWREFWNRSWIFVSGTKEAIDLTRACTLQRYLLACAGRGNAPIKFNGSLFTAGIVEDCYYAKAGFDADFRLWGGGYFWQNTRHLYWPMLKSGDYDMMQPLFQMYLRALPLAKERVRKYFKHDGAVFPEHMYFWGLQPNSDYGWKPNDVGLSTNVFTRYYWQGQIECLAMMLDYYNYTNDPNFLSSTLLPMADAVTDFYDQHYKRSSEGKLVLEPAQSLETWHHAVNPLPEIAGLKFITARLCSLPENLISKQQHSKWLRLQSQLPAIPTIQIFSDNTYKPILSPAEKFGIQANVENPQLYAVFPYRIYGIGKPGLDVGRLTYNMRFNRGHICWMQDEIHAAFLGLTDDAKNALIQRSLNKDKNTRFPAFWASPWESFPDQDSGGVLMAALQAMLIQSDGNDIFLAPAWPKDWDVDFKLHAPMKTTVQGTFRNGRIQTETLEILPLSRKKNLIY